MTCINTTRAMVGGSMAKDEQKKQSAVEALLSQILDELRAIRSAIEHPKATALKEIRDSNELSR